MQLKEKPELNQINQKSEASVKTYQPYRPIKEPKSVATVDIQPKEKPELNQINEQSKFLAKTYQPDRPIKEPKSVATTDRQNLQPIKERKSVATTDRQDLRSIKNRKSVATTYQSYLPSIKEYIPGRGTLRIIEFFVVVIIIGILSAIALPSFLHCGNKAMQSEAKQYLSSMNRAQQAYFADKGAFSNSITALGIGIKTQTTNYNYSIGATKNAAFSYALPLKEKTNLTSYVGAVFLVPVYPEANSTKTTVSILCEAKSPGKTQPPNPILENDVPVCGDGTVKLTK